MTAIVGYKGNVKLGATGGTNVVAEVKTWEAPLAADLYDVTKMGDQWKDMLPGLVGSDVKIDCNYDPTDTNGIVALQNALLNGTSVIVNLYPNATNYFSGTIYIKQFGVKTPVNGPVEVSITGTFTGAISFT